MKSEQLDPRTGVKVAVGVGLRVDQREQELLMAIASATIQQLVGEHLNDCGKVRLELGCGDRKRESSCIGIDVLESSAADLVGDAVQVLKHFPTGSVDEISSYHFLEHVSNCQTLLSEAARVIKMGGIFSAVVPHFSNPYYYSDPTHCQPFGLYTLNYLVKETFTSRQVPQYEAPLPFAYRNATYVYKSTRPHYIRHLGKQVRRIFNSSTWMKEWYEESWIWLLPAYEIKYELVRIN